MRPPRDPRSPHGKVHVEQLARLERAYGAPLVGTVQQTNMAYAKGVYMRMEHRADRWWAVFEPFTWVDLPRGDGSQRLIDTATDWRRERWAQRYNKRWFEIIAAWSDLLTGASVADLASTNLSDGTFRLSNVTGWSRPSGPPSSARSAGSR